MKRFISLLYPLDRRSFLCKLGKLSLAAGGAWLTSCAPTTPSPAAKEPGDRRISANFPTGHSSDRAASAENPVKIGVILPYSGVYAILGENSTLGMQLYLESVGNVAGGRSIVMIKEDEGTPDDALRKARKLVEQDKVDILSGIVSSAAAYAIRDYVHETRTVMVFCTTGANELTRSRKSRYIFRAGFSQGQLNAPMGEWIVRNIGRRVFVTAADYAAGREAIDAFKETFLAAGGEVVGELYPPFPNNDYAPYLAQIAQARPDATYSFYGGSDAINFVRQYAEFGLTRDVRLCGAGFMLEQDTLPAQGQAALGGISSLHWALTLDTVENQRFVEAYQRRFGKDPDVNAVHGWDVARVIVETITQLQGDTSNKERIVDIMEGVSYASPRGPFSFDPANHNVIQNVYVREVREIGGKLTNVILHTFPQVRDKG